MADNFQTGTGIDCEFEKLRLTIGGAFSLSLDARGRSLPRAGMQPPAGGGPKPIKQEKCMGTVLLVSAGDFPPADYILA